MHKLYTACFLLVLLVVLQTKAFATTLNCKFKSIKVEGVQTISLSDSALFINQELEIPLERTKVKCGNLGRQVRLDGRALGYQVVLKSCANDVQMAGHLIDSVNAKAAEVICDKEL